MMRTPKSKKIKSIHILVGVLILVLPCLAFFQYKWIDELNRLEEEHLLRSVESSANQLSWTFSQKFYQLSQMFMLRQGMKADSEIINNLGERWEEYKGTDTTSFLRGIFFISQHEGFPEINVQSSLARADSNSNFFSYSVREELINCFRDNDPMMQPARFFGGWSKIIMPVRDADELSGIVVFDVDSSYIVDSVFNQLLDEFYPFRTKQNLEFGILSDKDSRYFFTTSGFPAGLTDTTGMMRVPIGWISPFGKRIAPKQKHEPEPAAPPEWGREHKDHEFDHNNKKPHSSAEFKMKGFANAIGNSSPLVRPYWFVVSSSKGDVASAVHDLRWRNLIISFSVLLLLAFIIGMILYLSNKSQKIAQQKMQFISGLSHELRTPITVVRTAGDNLSAGISFNELKVKSYGQLIKKEIDRLWDMLETILFYTGFDSNRQMINPKEIKINEFISKLLNSKQGRIDEKRLVLKQSISNDLPRCFADENSLAIALNNIVDNAIKFNSHEGELSVSVEQSKSTEFVDIIVEDTGMGISRSDMKNIFEPFYRSRSAFDKNIQGSGIGLSLVKKISEANGWQISVDSIVGKGTRFVITIPIKQD